MNLNLSNGSYDSAITFACFLIGLSILIAAASEQSINSVVGGYSFIRLSVIIALAIYLLFLILGLKIRKLASLNTILAINVALTILAIEVILRLFANHLPERLLSFLPPASARTLLARRGLLTLENMAGNGLVYAYKPNTTIALRPWVTIDERGYRNPRDLGLKTSVVMLGDSVTIALGARLDMASHLRSMGIRSLNFGFNGYGPGQYESLFFGLLNDGLEAKVLVLNFCGSNDVIDSINYDRLERSGGRWQDYLGDSPIKGDSFLTRHLWTVSILYRFTPLARSIFGPSTDQLSVRIGDTVLSLPEDRVSIQSHPASELGWASVERHLLRLGAEARRRNLSVIFAYYPSLAEIYSPWTHNREIRLDSSQASTLRKLASQIGADFLDYTPAIQTAVASGGFSEHVSDYHPDDRGVMAMQAALLPLIQANINK